MDWTTKLSGDAYRAYWRNRMARGPEQAGWYDYSQAQTDEQAGAIWEFIRADLEALKPDSVLEFGSGYGRMLARLRSIYPWAWLYGVDICAEAVKQSWRDDLTEIFTRDIPPSVEPDLVFTCTALQHVTDRDTFASVVWAFNDESGSGTHFGLFENVTQPAAKHVLGFSADDYMSYFPDVAWNEPRILVLRNEPHAWMTGVRR